MKKMDTTMARVISSKQELTERHLQFFMFQILRALKYLHSANIIHRNLVKKKQTVLILYTLFFAFFCRFSLSLTKLNDKTSKTQ